MREKILRLALIVVLLGIIETIFPAGAPALEGVWFPLFDAVSGNINYGGIGVDLAHGFYAIHADVGEQNGGLYHELLAYNPSGNPSTIIWGMIRANMNGSLRFHGILDSRTSSWIESYGLAGTTYSIRPISSFF